MRVRVRKSVRVNNPSKSLAFRPSFAVTNTGLHCSDETKPANTIKGASASQLHFNLLCGLPDERKARPLSGLVSYLPSAIHTKTGMTTKLTSSDKATWGVDRFFNTEPPVSSARNRSGARSNITAIPAIAMGQPH